MPCRGPRSGPFLRQTARRRREAGALWPAAALPAGERARGPGGTSGRSTSSPASLPGWAELSHRGAGTGPSRSLGDFQVPLSDPICRGACRPTFHQAGPLFKTERAGKTRRGRRSCPGSPRGRARPRKACLGLDTNPQSHLQRSLGVTPPATALFRKLLRIGLPPGNMAPRVPVLRRPQLPDLTLAEEGTLLMHGKRGPRCQAAERTGRVAFVLLNPTMAPGRSSWPQVCSVEGSAFPKCRGGQGGWPRGCSRTPQSRKRRKSPPSGRPRTAAPVAATRWP